MELVKRLLLVAHALVIGPRLGNHHHHRVRQRTSGHYQQLQTIVEHRRVAAVGVDYRNDLFDVIPNKSLSNIA